MTMYNRKAASVSVSDFHPSPQHSNPMPDIRIAPNRWLKAPNADFYHGGVPIFEPVMRPANYSDTLTPIASSNGSMSQFNAGNNPPGIYNDTTQFFGGQGGGNNYVNPPAPGNTSGVLPSDPALTTDPTTGVPTPNPPVDFLPPGGGGNGTLPTYGNPPINNINPPPSGGGGGGGNVFKPCGGSYTLINGKCALNTVGPSPYNNLSIGGNRHGFYGAGTSDFYNTTASGGTSSFSRMNVTQLLNK